MEKNTYRVVISLTDPLDTIFDDRVLTVESSSAMEAHKEIYFKEITTGEDIKEIRTEDGEVVYDAGGFIDPYLSDGLNIS